MFILNGMQISKANFNDQSLIPGVYIKEEHSFSKGGGTGPAGPVLAGPLFQELQGKQILIKTHGSESRGREEAACMCVFWPTRPLQ